jgi:hypothetical protein
LLPASKALINRAVKERDFKDPLPAAIKCFLVVVIQSVNDLYGEDGR